MTKELLTSAADVAGLAKARAVPVDMETECLFSEPEFARFIGKSLVTVRRYRRRGVGPVGIAVGRSVMFRREDLAAWMNANRIRPAMSAANDNARP